MANEIAKSEHIFVCRACGKTSYDRYGEQKVSQGWDESCMMNCEEFPIANLVYEGGLVVSVTKPKEETMEKHGVVLDPEKTKTANTGEKQVCPQCGQELEKDGGGSYLRKCPTHGTEPFEAR